MTAGSMPSRQATARAEDNRHAGWLKLPVSKSLRPRALPWASFAKLADG